MLRTATALTERSRDAPRDRHSSSTAPPEGTSNRPNDAPRHRETYTSRHSDGGRMDKNGNL
ncbi:MAG: hypothetical protein Q4E58_08130 [Prevotellaceae bacterium]|nr:hypothetical protein [Prevotellaceae bacterium]